jgi:hypothetical protein
LGTGALLPARLARSGSDAATDCGLATSTRDSAESKKLRRIWPEVSLFLPRLLVTEMLK